MVVLEIFNSDQGSQFTSDAFTDVLITKGIAISMDGKGSWRDNVFVERFWRTLKYEEVYLNAYESIAGRARRSVVTWSFTTAAVLTPRLTGAHPIKPTTPRCPSAWQHNARSAGQLAS
jgi:putative transposase